MKKELPDGIRLILFLAAAALCAFGARMGEADIVFQKAVNICMECIGLG